jgi:hypothetical protein
MNIQYMSDSAVMDKLVTSALFNSNQDQPFLAEYRLDIGDFPYEFWADTVQPMYPTVTVMLFDPTHSKLGNGNNRTGLLLGDNSIDPAGTTPADLQFPMDYVEFGVTNGYEPIDTIVFSEGDNIISVDLTYDYLSMNNSYVLTGGSFQGSDVVALPINNQRSIAEYGLKQTNQVLNNVVDTAEIQRYIGTSINFFQHPIPNIVVKPDYVYASSHILYAGDYVLLNTPSLSGVVTDSNGNVLEGSYVPGNPNPIRVNAYTARIKTIDISWNPTSGEDITLTFTFPIMNVPLIEWNVIGSSQYNGSNAGGLQAMYTTVTPAVNTAIGKGRGQEGAALYQTGGDFLSNRGNPFTEDVIDGTFDSSIAQDAEVFPVPIYAQVMPNQANVLTTSGANVKGDSALIYQLGFEVNTVNSSAQNTANTPNDVYLTILQPDGMAIYDSVLPLNQAVNILTLLSESHSSPATPGASAPLISNPTGLYLFVFRNSRAFGWVPTTLLSSLPAPTLTGGEEPVVATFGYIYCPVNASGDEFGMSAAAFLTGYGPGFPTLDVSWPAVAGAVSYNLYRADVGITISYPDILAYHYVTNVSTTFYNDDDSIVATPNTQPFDTPYSSSTGLQCQYNGVVAGAGYFTATDHYWYLITANNPENVETGSSQAITVFTGNNTLPQPDAHQNAQPATPQEIELSWPTVPYAQSYNVYRAQATTTTMPVRTSFYQIAGLVATNGPVTSTSFLDDGVTFTADMSATPPASYTPIESNNTYTAFANYSYNPNPADSKLISAFSGSPSTTIANDPTTPRIFLPAQYVASAPVSSVNVYGSIGSWTKGVGTP